MKKTKRRLLLLVVTVLLTWNATAVFADSGSWIYQYYGWYYLNEDGYYATGWVQDNNTWYYLNDYGLMETGWIYDSGNWYYLRSSGAMQTGWLNDNGTWYYLRSSGAMQTGWVLSGGNWYFMRGSGAMRTGWVQNNGNWYYMNADGAMRTGWVLSGGIWYYMNADGAMQTGWVKAGGKWYYMNTDGAMQTGWIRDAGTWYYLDENGAWDSTRVYSDDSDSNDSNNSNSDSTSTNGLSAENRAVMRNIIGAFETGGLVYGQQDYSIAAGPYANTSIEVTVTLGAFGFYGNTARTLINMIYEADPAAFRAIDTTGAIEKKLQDNWEAEGWDPTSAEMKVLIALISSDIGVQCQNDLQDSILASNVTYCIANYTDNTHAVMMYCDIAWQGGIGAANRIFNQLGDDYSMDNIMKVLSYDLADGFTNQVGDYTTRRELCRTWIETYAK